MSPPNLVNHLFGRRAAPTHRRRNRRRPAPSGGPLLPLGLLLELLEDRRMLSISAQGQIDVGTGSLWIASGEYAATELQTSLTQSGIMGTGAGAGELVIEGGIGDAVLSAMAVAPSVPGAPSNVTAVPGNGQVSLTWTAPSSTGGTAIVNYVIARSSDGGRGWMIVDAADLGPRLPNATSAMVTGLTNGTAYLFRVAAVNSAGPGVPSEPSAAARPLGPLTIIKYSGTVALAHDSAGRLVAGSTMITLSESPVDFHAYAALGWQAVAAENVAGVNTLVWRHASGALHYWRLSPAWAHQLSEGWVIPGSAEYFAAETDFSVDLNADGVIGDPLTILENSGSVRLAHDPAGRLLAGSTMITLGGAPVDYHAFAAVGWRAVAAENIEGVNTLVWRHASGALHYWRLSPAWGQQSSEGWVNPGSAEYFAAEAAFGVDLNADRVIGDPVKILE